ncbi:MAG: tol-pal system YbgF family protein [Sandaracinaceae bacterium]
MSHRVVKHARFAATLGAVGLLMWAAPAFAQEQDEPLPAAAEETGAEETGGEEAGAGAAAAEEPAAEEPAANAPPRAPAENAQQAMSNGGMTQERQLDDDAAREHFRIAQRYYDEGRFPEAASQFEEAYELSGRAELLYNAYIAHREANQLPDAAAMLEQYLNRVLDAPDRVNLEARLVQLQQTIAEDSEQQAALEAARARAEREAAARREAESQGEAWPWVILGVGGAAVIGGVVTGVLALSATNDLTSQCDEFNLCSLSQIEIDSLRDDARTLGLVTDVLLIGGATIAATGLVLGLLFGLGGDSEPDVEASAACTGTGCIANVQGSF